MQRCLVQPPQDENEQSELGRAVEVFEEMSLRQTREN
jgi:hypothetical protein